MKKPWIVGGVALVIVIAGTAVWLAKRGSFGGDAVGRPQVADGATRVKLLGDIEQYRLESGGLAPEQAAARWFELYDRASALGARPSSDDDADFDTETLMAVGVPSLFASLPPPPSWKVFREQAAKRAGARPDDIEALGLRLTGELLTRDLDGAAATLNSLEEADAEKDAVIQMRSLLARLYGDEAARISAFEAELRAADDEDSISVPNLHALVGEQRASALLLQAIASPASLSWEGGAETRTLAQKIALENLARMKTAQWQLAANLDGAPLYEAMVKKFGAPGSEPYENGHVATYYFLRMVSDGRQADAERALLDIARSDDVGIPRAAVDALERAQLNEPLYRFLHAQLERRPTLGAWDVYLEQAAFTGHSRDALQLIDKLLARKDLEPRLRSALAMRRIAALLAADQVEPAAAELLARFKGAPAAGSNEFSAAVNAAAVGRLLGRKDLADAGITFAVAIYQQPRKDDDDFSLLFEQPRLFAELRKQGRGAEAERIIRADLARSIADKNSPGAAYRMSKGRPELLAELVAILGAAGRSAELLEQLAKSDGWGAGDLAELLDSKDSLGVPVAAIVARALRATGDNDAALRVASAGVLAMPGHDAAYEIVAALDPQAETTFDGWFALDEFEERPLIWKASHQLARGARGEAEETIRQAIAIDPSDGEEGPNDRMRAYAVLADILRRKGDAAQAGIYEGAVRAIRMSEQADELHAAGLYERAFAKYRAALEQFSDAYCIQSRLAVQLNKQGRRAEALAHYRRAYELMPTSFGRVESHCFGCENVFQGEESQSVAEKVFTQIIARAPRNAQAHYLLAYLREQQGRHSDALQPLRAAVAIDDHYLSAWKRLDDLGEFVYIDSGEQDIARLKRLELDPLQRHGHYSLKDVGALAELWNGVARGQEVQRRATPPAKVYPLAAAGRQESLLPPGMPPEIATRFARMMQMAMTDRGPGTALPTPASALADHELIGNVQMLMGIVDEEFFGF